MNSRRRRTRGGDAATKLERAIDQLDASIGHTEEMMAVVADIKEVVDEVKKDGGDATEAMVEVFNKLVPDPEPYFDNTVLESEKTVVHALAPEGATKAESVANIKSVFDRLLDAYHDIGVNIHKTADNVARTVQGRNDHYTTCVVLHYVVMMRRDEARKMRAKLVADAEGAKTEIDMKRIVNAAARWGTAAHILNNTFKAVVTALFVRFVTSYAVVEYVKSSSKNGFGVETDTSTYKYVDPDKVTEDKLFATKLGLHPLIAKKVQYFAEAINKALNSFMRLSFSFVFPFKQ
jgi:hypothetical protein